MENNRFKKGIKDSLPICMGYFSVAFAFGIFAVASGLTVLQSVLISMTNLTSAGQLAAVPIICGGGSVLELAISQLIINSRYSLMSISLSQKLSKNVSTLDRLYIAFGNTDEIFAVSVSNDEYVGKKYMIGLILTPFLGWSMGTLVGAVAGNVLPSVVTTSLSVAIYGMFIAIIVPQAKKEKNAVLCVCLAVILSCAFKYVPFLNSIPSGFVIVICAVVVSTVMALLYPIKVEEVPLDE